MLVLGIILLAFPIGIILTGIFGRKYNDLTDEEKEIYHRIEKEKEEKMKRRHRVNTTKPTFTGIPWMPYV
jgi:hypothetical protein